MRILGGVLFVGSVIALVVRNWGDDTRERVERRADKGFDIAAWIGTGMMKLVLIGFGVIFGGAILFAIVGKIWGWFFGEDERRR